MKNIKQTLNSLAEIGSLQVQILRGNTPVPSNLRRPKKNLSKQAEIISPPIVPQSIQSPQTVEVTKQNNQTSAVKVSNIKNYMDKIKSSKKQQISAIKTEEKPIVAIPKPTIQTQPKPSKPNYGEESHIVEFKTSFFFAPDDGHTDREQETNIMKEICAFLNNGGGTLYIGVEDNGNIADLKDDFDQLLYVVANRKKKNNYYGKDGYIRYIQDRIWERIPMIKKYGLTINLYFDKNDVLVIEVPKGVKDVVKLDNGNAYKRIGNECIVMTKEAITLLKEQREKESRMGETEKKFANMLSTIKQARNCKKRIILHGYHSSSSSTTSDRLVEVFSISRDNQYITAYDIDKNQVRTYKLCRINSVEILNNESWQCEKKHQYTRQDIFNMSSYEQSQQGTEVQIELTLRAKNLLEEEYPHSKSYIEELSDTKWLLKTTIYDIKGIGRFCMGLLDDITVLVGDSLKEYICNSLKRHLYTYDCNMLLTA